MPNRWQEGNHFKNSFKNRFLVFFLIQSLNIVVWLAYPKCVIICVPTKLTEHDCLTFIHSYTISKPWTKSWDIKCFANTSFFNFSTTFFNLQLNFVSPNSDTATVMQTLEEPFVTMVCKIISLQFSSITFFFLQLFKSRLKPLTSLLAIIVLRLHERAMRSVLK